MTKTPNQSSGFFAVRKGKGGLQRCIFLDWNDCEAFVDAEEEDTANSVEFHVFDTVDQAIVYLKETPTQSEQVLKATAQTKMEVGSETSDALQATRAAIAAVLAPSTKKTTTKRKDPTAAAGNTKRRKTSKIRKSWMESLDELKAYIARNGSCTFDKNDAQHASLSQWASVQQSEYRKMCRGQENSMTKEKVELLREAGFKFNYSSWEKRVAQLQAYQDQHGHIRVPPSHDELGKWMQSVRKDAKTLVKTGKPSKELTAERLFQLTTHFGFDPSPPDRRRVKTESTEQEDEEWYACFEKLQQYKMKHGDLHVSPKTDKELHAWATAQRSEYKRLQQDKTSRLTAHRLTRLTDLGFEFSIRGVYKSWEERVEDLREYKKVHGHVNVNTGDDALGEWASRQRKEYRLRQEGKKSAMTPERIQILTDLGFNFHIKPRAKPSTQPLPSKTWDERFQELLQYKEQFGNTMVPKHSDYVQGLASWVKTQRMQYKKMLAGKKTTMTADKALKLTNIGFVFDATDFSRFKKRKEEPMSHEQRFRI